MDRQDEEAQRAVVGRRVLKITEFESRARIRGKDTFGSFETLSMVMVDYDYNGKVFDLDAVSYAHQLQADDWQLWLPLASLGENAMVIFLDIYGNESRVLVPRAEFGLKRWPPTASRTRRR